jgi:hypothetical protein
VKTMMTTEKLETVEETSLWLQSHASTSTIPFVSSCAEAGLVEVPSQGLRQGMIQESLWSTLAAILLGDAVLAKYLLASVGSTTSERRLG